MSLYSRAINFVAQVFAAQPRPPPPDLANVNQAIMNAQDQPADKPRRATRAKRRPKALRTQPTQTRTAVRKTGQGRRRGPITPTTRKKIVKKAKHTRTLNKRKSDQDAEKILEDYRTYWRVLRSGNGYRSLIGASSWKKAQRGQGLRKPTASGIARRRS